MTNAGTNRSFYERLRQLSYIAVTVVIMAYACAFSLNAALRAAIPDVLIAVLPEHRLARLNVLDREAIADPSRIAGSAIVPIARDALAVDPLNARALLLLSVARAAVADTRAANALVDLSERVTRRDILTQFALIERAVGAGDIATALRHYDVAIRTHPDSKTLLYDRLSAASSDPEIATALRSYVRTPAPWMEEFLVQLLDRPGGAASVATLIATSGVAGRPDYAGRLVPETIGRLTDQGDLNAALRLASALPDFVGTMTGSAGFGRASQDPRIGPLAWQVTDDGASTIEWVPERTGMTLVVSSTAIGFEDKVLMRRVVALAPGPYRFGAGVVRHDGGTGPARLAWRVSCLRTGRPPDVIWRGLLPSASMKVAAEGPLIPADCRWQNIELMSVTGDGPGGYDATISDFGLTAGRVTGA